MSRLRQKGCCHYVVRQPERSRVVLRRARPRRSARRRGEADGRCALKPLSPRTHRGGSALEVGVAMSDISEQLSRRTQERGGIEAKIRQLPSTRTLREEQIRAALEDLGGVAELLGNALPRPGRRLTRPWGSGLTTTTTARESLRLPTRRVSLIVSGGGLEPPRPLRALAPQASASAIPPPGQVPGRPSDEALLRPETLARRLRKPRTRAPTRHTGRSTPERIVAPVPECLRTARPGGAPRARSRPRHRPYAGCSHAAYGTISRGHQPTVTSRR